MILKLHGLRHDQVLAVGRELGLSASDVERSHRSNLQLLPVVVVKLFGNGHSLLLNFYVFPGEDQFPISSDGVRDGGDRLLGESPVRDFAVVLGDADVSSVHGTPETVQQLLLEPDKNRRCHGGVEQIRRRSGRVPGVVPGSEESRAGLESLGILSVKGRSMQRQSCQRGESSAGSGCERVVNRDVAVVDAQGRGDNGIIVQHRVTRCGAAKHSAGSDAAKASGARFEDAGVREPGIVTLHHDVHAVFQRQLHRLLHA